MEISIDFLELRINILSVSFERWRNFIKDNDFEEEVRRSLMKEALEQEYFAIKFSKSLR